VMRHGHAQYDVIPASWWTPPAMRYRRPAEAGLAQNHAHESRRSELVVV
jgi:hypothetical protein